MKKTNLFFISMVACLISFQAMAQYYVIEAEDTISTITSGTHVWSVETALAGADEYLQVLPDDGANAGNSGFEAGAAATYDVDFNKAGTYYFWFRGNSLGKSTANSFHLGINDGTDTARIMAVKLDGAISDWQWTNWQDGTGSIISYDVVAPGTHEIILWMREAGAAVDQMIITMIEDFTPSDIIEIASPYYEFEAENPVSTIASGTHDWSIETGLEGADEYLQALPDDETNTGNSGYESAAAATYFVNFAEAGTYYLWFRGNSLGKSTSNSFHLGINDGTDTARYMAVKLDGATSDWQWTNWQDGTGSIITYNVVTPGVHEMIFWMREAGAAIDKIAITQIESLSPNSIIDLSGSFAEIEAEDFSATSDVDVYSWELVSDTLIAGMSGGLSMQASPNDSINNFGNDGYTINAPSVSYFVDFAVAGTYKFTARANALASFDKNSFHLGISDGMDTTTYTRIDIDGNNDNWQWVNQENGVGTVMLEIMNPGVHEIIFWAREIGVVIDKFTLSADLVMNGSFEKGIEYWNRGWGNMGEIVTDASMGDSALMVSSEGWTNGTAQRIDVEPLSRYVISMYAKVADVAVPTDVKVSLKDSEGNNVGSDPYFAVNVAVDTYTEFTYEFNTLAGVDSLDIWIGDDTEAIIYVDAISLVKIPNVSVEGVSLDLTNLTIDEGATGTLVAAVSPSDATNPAIVWSSNDESVATVSEGGVVTGVEPGTATITVTTNDGDFSAECTVTVEAVVSVFNNEITTIMAYPNPASSQLNIEVNEKMIATIFNSNGTIVEELNLNKGLNAIDVTLLHQGLYIIQIQNSTEQFKATFIKK